MKKLKNNMVKWGISLLSYLVPKKKNLYVYLLIHNRNQFSGNIKSLMVYAQKNHPEIQGVLVTFDKNARLQAMNAGVAVSKGGFSAYWNILRAEHLIIDATAPFYAVGRFSIVQLWHGAGFKNIGLLNDILSEKYKKQLKKHYRNYKLVACTSPSDGEKQRESFGTDSVQITGYPRNDYFFMDVKKLEKTLETLEISKDYNRIITYMPTFRSGGNLKPFSDLFLEELNEFLKESDDLLLIKKHPWEKHLKLPKKYSNIIDVTSKVVDVQQLLLVTDVLISDYSAVSTDFSITGRPIIFYCYDFTEYIQESRSLYYDMEAILPKPFTRNEEDLLNRLKDDSWMESEAFQKSYANFRKQFHSHLDGKSSERVMAAIKKL